MVCFKRRELLPWLPAYIAATLSEIIRLFSVANYDIYYFVSLAFSSFTLILLIIAVTLEYRKTFFKLPRNKIIPILQISTVQLIISIGFNVIIGILLIIALFMTLRITLKTQTPTHAFISFILLCGLLNLITITLRDAGLDGAEVFYQFVSMMMGINVLLTGLVPLIEERLVKSENKYRLAFNRAEFYKDLFVHDINNILQNLEFSLEIIAEEAGKQIDKKKITELVNLAKTQVNRGAELGVNVRKLSDLESGEIKNTLIQVNEILEKAITYVKTRFIDKKIRINFNSMESPTIVYANEILYDVFRIILNNAIRYNESQEKEITINISNQQEKDIIYMRMEFIDNGIGMPDKRKENIFYNFYEQPKSHKRIGLGLLLVREAIHSFKGSIWAEDRIKGDYKNGTKVILKIPEKH
ncbi:MAG: sensor histidine kinase [Promethearchaeota archaeon]|jgi:signal transduction histidine kinase